MVKNRFWGIASNVYDDDPSNVESGLDYSKRGELRTHIQDIAIGNCVKRFRREPATDADNHGQRSEISVN